MAYRPRTRIWTPAALSVGVVRSDDLKDHLRITSTSENSYVAAIGLAATSAVERWTQRLLTVRTAVLRLENLPTGQCPIELPGGAVASVTSVVADGVTITGCVALGESPAVLVPSADWPTVIGEGYPVVITYQVGLASVPGDLVQAIKMIAADMYTTRENVVDGPSSKAIISAEWLMAPHRIWAAA
ncbi:MAG: head-tail connector protein [Microgenomates group bacterium]